MGEKKTHPLAVRSEPGSSGALGMKSGDRVVHIPDGRACVADEFLHDGDALVTFEDGEHGIVKWNNLKPETERM